jgi:hypothetical protein
MTKMPSIFICYSHKDKGWRDRLLRFLQPLNDEGQIVWSDLDIQPGDIWDDEIKESLSQATVAIVLVSQDLLNSRYVRNEELPRLLQRREREGTCIIPIYVRHCTVKSVSFRYTSNKGVEQGFYLNQFQSPENNSPNRPLCDLTKSGCEKVFVSLEETLRALIERSKSQHVDESQKTIDTEQLAAPRLGITHVVGPDQWSCGRSSPRMIDWTEICQQLILNKPLRRLATDEPCEVEIFVPLGLVERKKQQRRPINQEMEINRVYELEEKEAIIRRFEHEEFLNYIGLGTTKGLSSKNIAIIGEPGSGKTALLQNLALIISDKLKGLAICVSLGALAKNQSLIGYLEEAWLRDGLAKGETNELDKSHLRQLFENEKVWLILDGLDEYPADSPVEALTWIENEIRSGYLQKARVVVSCRTNVWDAYISPLWGFITYKTLDFADFQRDQFIGQWFIKKGNKALGEQLIACLQKAGRERICELVRNPLRLVLLCQIWSLGKGSLPETKSQFFHYYLPYFYEWKRDIRNLIDNDELQEMLHV